MILEEDILYMIQRRIIFLCVTFVGRIPAQIVLVQNAPRVGFPVIQTAITFMD